MRLAANWKDYELIDASSNNRLERWGNKILIRPDPQVIWNTPQKNSLWKKADACYHRSSQGGGNWEYFGDEINSQQICWQDLKFNVKPTGFKHMGLFPEQAANWEFFMKKIKDTKNKVSVLNLFAYTGGATLACAKAGASVCHVDASKGMVLWAKENAKSSGLEKSPIRWIVDDCEKFVLREIRRGRKYDAIILDPPSYGRGPSGEIWKIEDKIYHLLINLSQLLSDMPLFFALNSYTCGLSPSTMKYLLDLTVSKLFLNVSCDEIGLKVKTTNFELPCGSTALAFN